MEGEGFYTSIGFARETMDLIQPGAGRIVDPVAAVGRYVITSKKDRLWMAQQSDGMWGRSAGALLDVAVESAEWAKTGSIEGYELERLLLDLDGSLSAAMGLPTGGAVQATKVISGAMGHPIGKKPKDEKRRRFRR